MKCWKEKRRIREEKRIWKGVLAPRDGKQLQKNLFWDMCKNQKTKPKNKQTQHWKENKAQKQILSKFSFPLRTKRHKKLFYKNGPFGKP